MAGPLTVRGFMRSKSTSTTPYSISKGRASMSPRTIFGRFRKLATPGCSHQWHRSTALQPAAMAYPLSEPIDAPTTKSGLKREASERHAPACQAPNIPPPERTSAVLDANLYNSGCKHDRMDFDP